MKRLFSAALLLCALCYAAFARTPELRFNDGGKFKVLQLTDLHLVGGYDAEASKTLKQVKEFVIPLPEFLEAWERTTSEYFTHNNVDGVRGEYGGHSRMNSGMFAAMFEAGSIMAVLCGHDHDSDFIVNHYGISLIYGRCSGNDPTYHHLLPGARVIEFREGRREFSSWIREENGKISYVNDYSNGVLK